jgi:hypothetical protein
VSVDFLSAGCLGGSVPSVTTMPLDDRAKTSGVGHGGAMPPAPPTTSLLPRHFSAAVVLSREHQINCITKPIAPAVVFGAVFGGFTAFSGGSANLFPGSFARNAGVIFVYNVMQVPDAILLSSRPLACTASVLASDHPGVRAGSVRCAVCGVQCAVCSVQCAMPTRPSGSREELQCYSLVSPHPHESRRPGPRHHQWRGGQFGVTGWRRRWKVVETCHHGQLL